MAVQRQQNRINSIVLPVAFTVVWAGFAILFRLFG